jgi:lactoylglutathione lyase
MRYLHTMIRVTDPDASVRFFNLLGLTETRRVENSGGRFTLIFMAADEDHRGAGERADAEIELTWNWPPQDGSPAEIYTGGRNFGHLAYRVDDIYAACARLAAGGVTINRPPRDGHMAFVRSPDGISVELLQAGESKPPAEPWASMPNTGVW